MKDNTQLKETFRAEIPGFAEKARAFAAGEIDRKAYKGISGGFGSYAQRGETGNMLRLRLPGGRVTKEQLAFLANMVEQHDVKRMKITTCQTIQLHDLTADAVVDIMEKAIDCDIITRGGGGDHPRNVMVNPLSGLETGEYFDVRPVAEAVGRHLVERIWTLKMPRKLKVAFSNGVSDEVHATFRDLGFVARQDGTFDVYCAGGLGPNPKLGILAAEGVQPKDAACAVEAMIDVFCTHGNYENRAKARTRYLQDTLGEEGLRSAFAKAMEKAAGRDDVALEICEWQPQASEEELTLPMERVTAQKQHGLYAVEYHPMGGVLTPDAVRRLNSAIGQLKQAELRLHPCGGLYIVNLTAQEVPGVLNATEDSAKTPFECSTACIGASTCQQGVRDSQALLTECVQAVREAGIAANALPKMGISGCPSSCGTHQACAMGFVGGVKMIDKVAHPAFTLFLGGRDALGKEAIGTSVCAMLQAEIPAFLVELGRTVEQSSKSFDEWIEANEETLRTIAQKYAR